MQANFALWYLSAAIFFYIISCFLNKSFIHILTPFFLINIASSLFFDYVYFKIFTSDISIKTLVQIYNIIILNWLGFFLGFCCKRKKKTQLSKNLNQIKYPKVLSWLLLVLAVILYMFVLVPNYDLANNPRDIYSLTRTGNGLYYYSSMTLMYLSVIFYLFSYNTKKKETFVFISILVCLLSIYGSKSPLISILFIVLIYYIYVKKQKYGLMKGIPVLLSIITVVIFAFKITKPDSNFTDSLKSISVYTDYNRNAALVIEDPFPSSNGMLFLEDIIYSIIPRQVMPSKPKNFGSFKLSEFYYPDWFNKDCGSPAFGVGLYLSEFKNYAGTIMFVASFFNGFILNRITTNQNNKNKVSNFILVLFFSGVSIVQLGVGFQVLPIIILVLIIAFFEKSIKQKAVTTTL